MFLPTLLLCELLFLAGLAFIAGFRLSTPARTFSTHRALFMNADSRTDDQLGIVTMYKKDSCPYCKKAKELLEGKYQLKISYVDVEEPDQSKRDDILQQMRNFSGGRNTVPQIFFNAEHLGGNDDVQKLDQEGVLAFKVDLVRKTPVSMMMDHWYHPWY